MFQESRSKEFKFIRLLISCHQKLQCFVTILHDHSLGMELVQNNILVLLVNKELKLTSPCVEGCQELIVADEILVQDGFRIDYKSIMKNELKLVLIVDLLSRPGNFEHLHSSLLCQHTDISSVVSIVSTSSFQVQTSQDIGINNQALANLVICCDLDGRFLDSPSCEKVWSCKGENIWTDGCVSFQVNSLASILLKVDFNFEFRGKMFLCFLSTKDM